MQSISVAQLSGFSYLESIAFFSFLFTEYYDEAICFLTATSFHYFSNATYLHLRLRVVNTLSSMPGPLYSRGA